MVLKCCLYLLFLQSFVSFPALGQHAADTSYGNQPDTVKKPNRNKSEDSSNKKLSTIQRYTFHMQATVIHQKHPSFPAAFNGRFGEDGGSTLDNRYEQATSLTATLFFGVRLWNGASAYFNPEITGGRGFSKVTGIAGFPNGESYRVGTPSPTPFVARAYFEQTLSLSKEKSFQEDDVNQVARYVSEQRIVFRAGKYSLLDYFDDNAVSHDPRSDFMNWGLMGMGAWDYPADTRGYTFAISGAYVSKTWSALLAVSTMPTEGNGPIQDKKISKAHSLTFQLERKYLTGFGAGRVKVIAYRSKYNGAYYQDLTDSLDRKDTVSVTKATGNYNAIKWGGGINVEQALTTNLSLAARASWNDGKAVTWAFTSIDRSYSLGFKMIGKRWNRPEDHIGLSGLLNGISKVHRRYLSAGGLDFLVGDGALPKYATEKIIELYYSARFFKSLKITPDYQFVHSPAYNPLRGPVHVFSLRLHVAY